MPKISRRTALARGGQAVAVAAAFPVIHNIAAEAAQGDAEVFTAYEEWKRLEKAASAADTEADLRHNAVQGLLPPKPPRWSISTVKEGSPEWDRLLTARTLIEGVEELRKEGNEKAQRAWRAECKSIYEREGVSELRRKADAAWQVAYAAETRFLETPARTPAGVLLKLRAGCESRIYELEYAAEDGTPAAPPAVRSALADLERLAGPFVPAAGDDTELFELHAAWKRLEEAAEKTDSGTDWRAAFAAEDRFIKTSARTLAGLLFKLKVGCEPRNYSFEYPDEEGGPPSGPPAVLAVLRDLERMAGRAA